MVLVVEDVGYSVGGREVLKGVSLTVEAGTSAVVLGRSGSGKSTLLMCVLGLVKPSEGSIRVNGVEVVGISATKLAALRSSRIGVVFQDGELLPELSAVENVALAALLSGRAAGEAYERATKLLEDFDVPLETPTGMLSGGERQRTAVARALINEPGLLVTDEPTGSLDEANRDAVAELLFSLPNQRTCALVVVTHDRDVAGRADEVWQLTGGRLEQAVR